MTVKLLFAESFLFYLDKPKNYKCAPTFETNFVICVAVRMSVEVLSFS